MLQLQSCALPCYIFSSSLHTHTIVTLLPLHFISSYSHDRYPCSLFTSSLHTHTIVTRVPSSLHLFILTRAPLSRRSMHLGGVPDRGKLSVMSDQELTDYMKEHFRWFVGMMDRAQVRIGRQHRCAHPPHCLPLHLLLQRGGSELAGRCFGYGLTSEPLACTSNVSPSTLPRAHRST
jgi:hypothetical protein